MDLNKIDMHQHVTLHENSSHEDGAWSDCRHMKEHMERLNIVRAVALSSGEDSGMPRCNEEVYQIAQRFPEAYDWFCSVDIEKTSGLEKRLEGCHSRGAKGIGEFTAGVKLNDDRMKALFTAAQELQMPFLFHISPIPGKYYGILDRPGLPFLEEMLDEYPKQIFIGHSQPFWHEISGDASSDPEARNTYPKTPVLPGGRLPALLRRHPNLYADLSANSGGLALLRDAEFAYSFLEEFQDKLLFGTDMVSTSMIFPLGKWLDESLKQGRISQTVYQKICRENARKLLKLN